MVEIAQKRKNILVKLSCSVPEKICKRVSASDYATLMVQAAKLAAKSGQEPLGLQYHDGLDWIMIEDDTDLNFAYDYARTSCKRQTQSIIPASLLGGEDSQIIFNVLLKGLQDSKSVSVDTEMKDDSPSMGQPKGKKNKDKMKGIPRKALKNLINKEFEKQAKEAFDKLLKSDDLPLPEMTAEEAEKVHEGVSCDGCSVAPIVGIRYKCSVCKNFDYCAKCEDRLEHEHAFLKISQPGGAPDVMITMLNEDQPQPNHHVEEEQKGEPKAPKPWQFFNQFMGGRGGRGVRGGRGGRGGCRGQMMQMFDQFMNNCNDGSGNFNHEEFGKKVGEMAAQFGKQWQGGEHNQFQGDWNFEGKKRWNVARAIIKGKPQDVLELAPGMTDIVEIEVFNDTFWPWKPGCTLTFADEQPDGCSMPLEIFTVPIEQDVKGKSGVTIEVPITMGAHVIADCDKIHEMNLTFRGPKGNTFGEVIPIKVKCVLPKRTVSEVETYKLAIKLHEKLHLGSLDECIKSARENNGDEAESIKALQRKA